MGSVLLSIRDEIAEVDTLGEESLSFGSLYLIQGEIMNSQLQPRPTRQASDLSQVRSIVDCGNINITMEEIDCVWDKVLRQENWRSKQEIVTLAYFSFGRAERNIFDLVKENAFP